MTLDQRLGEPDGLFHRCKQGYVVKPDVVSMELIEPAVDVLWEEIVADRDDPKTWINAGPRGNLKCGSHPVVRATLSESPIDERGDYVDLPDPIDVTGPPGTVTFWHHLIAHSAGVNCGEEIRMAFVSRFRRKDNNAIRFETPDDMSEYTIITLQPGSAVWLKHTIS